jgi:hypothetical protein
MIWDRIESDFAVAPLFSKSICTATHQKYLKCEVAQAFIQKNLYEQVLSESVFL